MKNDSPDKTLQTAEVDSDEVEQSEIAKLRERVAELEREVDRWKNEAWVLEHDYPGGDSARGRRRGDSKVSETLNELQQEAIISYVAENTTGDLCIGSILLLIEYLGSLAFNKKFNDLDMTIADLRRGLISDEYSPVKTSVEELRITTINAIDDWITFRVTSDISRLSQTFQGHVEQRSREKRSWGRDNNV